MIQDLHRDHQYYVFDHPELAITVDLLAINLAASNLQATKLFATSAGRLPRGGGGYQPHRFSVWFKILYRVIQRLIHHCFLNTMVYLNVKYI